MKFVSMFRFSRNEKHEPWVSLSFSISIATLFRRNSKTMSWFFLKVLVFKRPPFLRMLSWFLKKMLGIRSTNLCYIWITNVSSTSFIHRRKLQLTFIVFLFGHSSRQKYFTKDLILWYGRKLLPHIVSHSPDCWCLLKLIPGSLKLDHLNFQFHISESWRENEQLSI